MDSNELFPTLPGEAVVASSLSSIELTTAIPCSIGRLQQCLALLIKIYTSREAASFAYVRSVYTNTARVTLARVLQYRSSTESGAEIVYNGWKTASTKVLEEDRVNTALLLFQGSAKGETPSPALLKQWTGNIAETKQCHLQIVSIPAGPTLFLQYKPNFIPDQYAETVARTFENIVNAHRENILSPETWLTLAADTGREHLLNWNGKSPTPEIATVHEMVQSMAHKDPQAEAVCAWDGSLRYGQLDSLSDTMAKQLRSAGVRKGMYVGYAFTKFSWAVVAMLGILKAGGAFVALDPLQSAERLEEMARVLGCTVVVTSDVHLSKILSLPVQALVLPRDLEIAKGGGCSDPVEVTSTDAALVLFTSGSTGQPKAMIHEHGSICSHAVALGEAMGYRGRRVLQFSAYIWDVAVMDIFITLIFGGCVCIPSEEDRVGNIAAFIRWSKADLALLTPSYSRSIDPQSVPSLKTLALAGECMTQEDVRRWGNHVTLMNAYGPAEVGVCSLNAATAQPENIGRGLPNSPCWVVNPNDVSQLVPLGAVGELVVAGPDLAREYLNQPELTANSFVVDPLWAVRLGLENRRFYRTGDLVCYDLNAFDGSMLFMGRKDDQIKVRGQRIEPGEIEYHLCQVPRVKHAVVTMPRRGFWKDELVAVVETSSYGGITSERGQLQALPADSFPLTLIQDHLAKFLPSFMVPTACVVLSYLPLTASMKINRKEVKTWLERSENKPKDADGEPMRPSEAVPLDKNEKTAWSISALIEKYLNTLNPDHPVALSGYDFSLQEAGLNSIQTITLFSMLRKLFGESVSLPAVMQTRLTVRNLARLIDRPKELSSYTVISPINLEAESRNISHQLLESLHCQMIVPQMKKSVVIRNVFLTGASGYLGREILRQLLAQQGVHVYVHMRSSGEKRFNDSIKQTATAEGWWNETFRNSYTVWPGDLTKRGLGLSRSHLDLLHGRGPATKVVNAVIHCGAVVHYAHDYETLRQPNVVSTMTLLEATARSKHLCSFVFISGGRNPNQQGKLDQPGQADKVLWNGYSQSKYVSDRVIRACNLEPAFDGKRICSVSPGYIIGSASNGRANTRDFIWRLIAGCIEIGAYNQDEADRWLFVFDVEGVSEAAVNALLKRGTSTDKDGVAPILEGVYFQTIWDILRVECGYSLHGIPGDRWLSKLKNAIFRTGETHPLFPLLPTLEINGQRLGEAGATFEPTLLVIECLRANIRYLIRTGFLPKPPSLAKGAVS